MKLKAENGIIAKASLTCVSAMLLEDYSHFNPFYWMHFFMDESMYFIYRIPNLTHSYIALFILDLGNHYVETQSEFYKNGFTSRL